MRIRFVYFTNEERFSSVSLDCARLSVLSVLLTVLNPCRAGDYFPVLSQDLNQTKLFYKAMLSILCIKHCLLFPCLRGGGRFRLFMYMQAELWLVRLESCIIKLLSSVQLLILVSVFESFAVLHAINL